MFLLFPVIINYLSPVLIIAGAYEGVVNGSFIIFTILLLTSLFCGRLWCGWICPASGMQQTTETFIRKNKTSRIGIIIKYVFLAFWLGLIVTFFIQASGIHNVNFLYQSEGFISILNPIMVFIYLGVIMLILISNLIFGNRAFCKYICWMEPFMTLGNFIRNKLNYHSYRIITDGTNCISCHKCNRVCPMSISVESMVKSVGYINSYDCIMCFECADACPKECISDQVEKIKTHHV